MERILIANRGEIAVRVIRACRELGLHTIAVHSQADAESLHVSLATEAYCIGPAQSAKSYLSIPQIISTALISGAEAIHPGYGFMAENADFAEICKDHGLKFVGPSVEAMRKMGDKAVARQTMMEHGIPVTPGTDIINSIAEAKAFVEEVGYPVIIKATAGGGGKAMRIVKKEEDLEPMMNICRSEAQNFFGNPDVYIEKFIENPRHIEVQIIADKFGNVVHLGERDCTVQRRNQKLIEESPSPVIDEKTRLEMGEASIKAAKAINYEGVGTCEYLLANDGKWYFMEMNTRIQVEHCVSEMLSNIDIVREQIRIAMGEKLSFTQDDVNLKGHVIECRINAEDTEKDFMPCAGKIEGYVVPGGFGVRVDSHCYQGYTIPPYYDSILAKVVCWGNTREEARRRMYRALREYVITGVKTTLPLCLEIIENKTFISGKYDTSFLEKYLEK